MTHILRARCHRRNGTRLAGQWHHQRSGWRDRSKAPVGPVHRWHAHECTRAYGIKCNLLLQAVLAVNVGAHGHGLPSVHRRKGHSRCPRLAHGSHYCTSWMDCTGTAACWAASYVTTDDPPVETW